MRRINALTICIVVAAAACTSSNQNTASHALNAEIQHAGFYVTVRNNDSQDWRDVRVVLNDNYRCPAVVVGAGATERLRMTSCVGDNQTAYDPLTLALEKVSVTARLTRDNVEQSKTMTESSLGSR